MELTTSTQVGLSAIALGNLVSNGMSVSFSTVAIPAVNISRGYDLKPDQASWIASLPQITMILGSFMVGPIVDSCGRRLSFVISVVFSLIGWISISMGNELIWIYTGRLLTGLSMGFSGPTTSAFLAEITSPSLRGPITVGKNIAFSIGVTLIYIIGWLFKNNWRMIGTCAAIVPSLTFILTLKYLPESKIWEQQGSTPKLSYNKFFIEYKKRAEVYIPFNIMNVILVLRQLSGTSVILAYAIEFLVKARVNRNKVYQVAICIGLSRVLFGLLAAWLSKEYGRRKPVAISGAIMSFTMMGLSLYLRRNVEKDEQGVLIAVVITFVASSTVFSGITQSIVGEVFPVDVRGVCCGLTSCTTYTTAFFVLKTFPWFASNVGGRHFFMAYATFCVLSAISTILLLPETNGKTLSEIKEMFVKNVEPVEVVLPLNSVSLKVETS